jgi:hypothetical protein
VDSDLEGTIIVDAELTHDLGVPFEPQLFYEGSLIHVLVSTSRGPLTGGPVKLGSRGSEFSFPLSALPGGPQTSPYNITCTAIVSDETLYTTTTLVHFLPENEGEASVTKMDLRTGSLLVRPRDKRHFEPIIPFGYYTGSKLLNNLAMINDIKAKGLAWLTQHTVVVKSPESLHKFRYNLIHPIPPFANETIQNEVFDRVDDAGA